MTALENVMVGRHVRTNAGVFGAVLRTRNARNEERRYAAARRELLDYVGIGKHANAVSKNLSYGDQRRLEIARALATEPKLLALDEPAAGMNATETASNCDGLLEKIRGDGVTHPADRARCEAGDGPVRPGRGARLRQENRRRRARCRATTIPR